MQSRVSYREIHSGWAHHKAMIQKTGAKTLIEFGAGRTLAQNLFLSQFVEKQVVVDISAMLDVNMVNQAIDGLVELGAEIDGRHISSLKHLEDIYNIEYRAPFDIRSTDFGDGSFDICVSTNVLEHIPADDIEAILRELHRILKEGGHVSAMIDYSDHYAHSDPSIGRLNYLQYAPSSWKKYNPSNHYQNRLRHEHYGSIFKKNGFTAIAENPTNYAVPAGVQPVDELLTGSETDFATTGYWLLRKEPRFGVTASSPPRTRRAARPGHSSAAPSGCLAPSLSLSGNSVIRTLTNILQIWRNLEAHPPNSTFASAAYHWISWQIRSRLTRDVTLDWIENLELTGRNGMISIAMQAYNGLHELRDMCFAAHVLCPEDLFFDVGANIGVYSLLIGRASGAHVVAFEPAPDALAYLERNIAQNALSDRITILRSAVSRVPGFVNFSTDADVMNRIIISGSGVIVPAVTLDDVSAKYGVPQLIKIDVEGFEPDVIEGGSRTIHDPALLALILEINDNAEEGRTDELLQNLHGAGFEEAGYDPCARELIAPSGEAALDNRLLIRAEARHKVVARARNGPVLSVRGRTF